MSSNQLDFDGLANRIWILLDRRYPEKLLAKLEDVTDDLELDLQALLEESLSEMFSLNDIGQIHPSFLLYNEDRHKIIVSGNEATRTLIVKIQNLDKKVPFIPISSLELVGTRYVGEYETISILVSDTLSNQLDNIKQLCKKIYHVGYTWLYYYMENAIANAEDDFVNGSYKKLEEYFALHDQSQLGERVLLGLTVQGEGIYIINQSSKNLVNQNLADQSLHVGRGKLLNELILTRLPINDMHVRQTISAENGISHTNLRESLYLLREPEYQFLERLFFGDEITQQMIYRDDSSQNYFFAVYPTDNFNEIQNIIKQAQPELSELVRNNRSKIRKVRKKLIQQSNDTQLAPIARFIGWIVYGYSELASS